MNGETGFLIGEKSDFHNPKAVPFLSEKNGKAAKPNANIILTF